MKWIAIPAVVLAAALSCACEQHKASELEGEHETPGDHAKLNPGATSEHPERPTQEQAKAESAATPAPGKEAEAPKFFPEPK